jgi:hypothetical protein
MTRLAKGATFFSLLLAAPAMSGCGMDDESQPDPTVTTAEPIINGSTVTSDTWGSPFWGCSSTLLRNGWLITAKHCGPAAGDSVNLLNGQTATMTNPLWVHPSLDVVIARLTAPLTPSGSAATRGPYPLYKGSENRLLNKNIYCQGWGVNFCPDDGGACGGFGTLRSGNLHVDVVNTGLPGFCNGSAGCFRTDFSTGQRVGGGDSGGGCMLTGSIVDWDRMVGVISGTSTTENFHVSAAWFRDWANGIIGTAPTFGALTGYERGDLVNTVDYVNPSSHIIELSAAPGNWSRADLTTFIGGVNAVGNPTAFVRWDGFSSVAFRSSDGHIQEFSLQDDAGWQKLDLTVRTSAPLAAGNPTSYSRSDRTGVVMYRSTSNHVIELSFDTAGNWWANDFNNLFGTPTATFDPVGYVRADGLNAVVYRSADGHIWEFALPIGGNWSNADLSVIAGASATIGQPRPYTRQDGMSAVLYHSSFDSGAHELELTPVGWRDVNLTSITNAPVPVTDPLGYVRADGGAAVVYISADHHIRELTWNGSSWSAADLTNQAVGAPLTSGSSLSAYVRSDRVSAVVFRTSDNHVHELRRKHDSTTWIHADLTAAAGGVI